MPVSAAVIYFPGYIGSILEHLHLVFLKNGCSSEDNIGLDGCWIGVQIY